MRVKFTIAVCALLVLALGASQAYAQVQSGGYSVSRSIETVVQHGKNQEVGQIQLDYIANGGDIDAGGTISITFGGLPVTASGTAECTNGATCGAATLKTDEDTGAGTVTIVTAGTLVAGLNNSTINLMGTRVDVSSLDAEDEIVATISTTAPSGLIPIGQSRRGTVSASVAEVKAGLVVKINSASRLICNLDATYDADGITTTEADNETPVGGIPMITVEEGFADAWETELGGTMITVKVLNLPKGVQLRWPDDAMAGDQVAIQFTGTINNTPDTVISTLTLIEADHVKAGLGGVMADNATDGSEVTFAYALAPDASPEVVAAAASMAESFSIPITVKTSGVESGAGGIADIWAFLSPVADDGTNLTTTLAYVMNPVTDPETDDGDFLNVAECVTYLLFPYITCGAHADWDTGIAIANTTMDEGIFGLSAGATAQRGSVIMYAFPTGDKTEHNATAMGYTGEPTMAMLSGGLAAGDSLAMTCSSNEMLAGMQGYAIVKAGFRHAHGMAFVTNSASGAVDAVHGYVALVIPDPEFGGDNADRAAAEGEVLGH